MTTLDDIYESSDWLKAADLQVDKDLIVTIASWETGELEKDSKTGGKYLAKQIVLHFEEEPKKLGLNKTNGYHIAELLQTQDPSQWVGARLKLYRTKVPMEARMVDAIRVRAAYMPSKAREPAMGPNMPSGSGAPEPGSYEPEDESTVPF